MRVHLGGSIIARSNVEAIPEIGTIVRVTTDSATKSLPTSSVIDVRITAGKPPEVYFGNIIVVDAQGYVLVQAGPSTD
jgi:hypothetical protein